MQIVRFGVFELDLLEVQLRKSGVLISLQPQPLQVLCLLVERAGEIVTRDELRHMLWPANTFVEFDQSLNAAVKKIRIALGDVAVNPRFIETLPRRGYRFIAPVSRIHRSASSASPTLAAKEAAPITVTTPTKRWSHLKLWALAGSAITAVVAMQSAGIALFEVTPRSESSPAISVKPLTTWPGLETEGCFSPDGRQVAFVWSGERGENFDVYVKRLDRDGRSRLTADLAPDRSPAWSPDARMIAFARELTGSVGVYIVTPEGGAERLIVKLGRAGAPSNARLLDWFADSRSIVVSDQNSPGEPFRLLRVSLETGQMQAVTSPPARSYGDSQPAVSPDGTMLAFVRSRTHPAADLYVMRTEGGEPRRVTFDDSVISGIAWTADSKGLIFSSERGAGGVAGSLWRVPIGRSADLPPPSSLPGIGARARWPATARNGGRLVYQESFQDTNLWLVRADGQNDPQLAISSTREEVQPDYSPDGRRIAFASNQSGNWEIWTTNADGSDPRKITSFEAEPTAHPKWSPDGRLIAFQHLDHGNFDIYTATPEGTVIRRVTSGPFRDEAPFWSADGRFLYFTSDRSGSREVWRTGLDDRAERVAVRMTYGGGAFGRESPDGKYLYFRRTSTSDNYLAGPDITAEIWRVSLAGGDAIRVLGPRRFGWWVTNQTALYFSDDSSIAKLDLARGRISQIVALGRKTMVNGLAVSSNGEWLLYGKRDSAGSDLMLAENFR